MARPDYSRAILATSAPTLERVTTGLRERTEAVPGTRPRRRRDPLLALPAGVLALLGGLLLLQRPSLWYDELYTAVVAPQPLSALVEAVTSGTGTPAYLAQVPPSYNAPYYALVHGWLALTGTGPGELSLRSLSLLAAVGGVALLVLAVARLAGRATAVVAGLLVATNPLVLEYAVEARGYGLAVLAVGAAALGLAQWLDGVAPGPVDRRGGPRRAGALVRAAGRRRAGAGRAAAAPPGGGAAAPPHGAGGRTGAGARGARLRRRRGRLDHRLDRRRRRGGAVAVAAGLDLEVPSPAAGRAGRLRARGPPTGPRGAVAACWVLVPLAVVVLAELLVRPVFVPRYLLPALLGLAVLVALGLTSRWSGRRLVVATAVAVAASLFASAPLATRPPRDDARGAVQALAEQQRPGEPVVAVDRRAAVSLEVYADDALRADLLLPPDDAPAGADVVWLLRHESYATGLSPSDDDELLTADGLRLERSQRFEGSSAVLVVQRWSRP